MRKLTPNACPICNGDPVGVKQSLTAIALIDATGDRPVFTGYTEPLWETQDVVTDENGTGIHPILVCANGHEYIDPTFTLTEYEEMGATVQ